MNVQGTRFYKITALNNPRRIDTTLKSINLSYLRWALIVDTVDKIDTKLYVCASG